MVCGAWACSNDRDVDPDVPGGNGYTDGEDKCMLLLRISPVDAGEAAATEVTERIKSLRIIVLTAPDDEGGTEGSTGGAGGADGGTDGGNGGTGGTDGSGGANDGAAAVPEIEYNRLITPAEFGTTTAAGFQYEIMLLTTKGKKDIYLIANEGSVGDIKYQPAEGSTLTGLPTTFSAFLERYEAADGKTPDAAEFKKAVEAIYFAPTYNTPDTEKDALYLPYTSHYEVEAVEGKENKLTMYLVPVATKFTFKFVNKLDSDVTVNEISVKSTDTHNFLLARVGEDDYEKDFVNDDGTKTKMYWVNWLAKVAEATHNAPGNNAAINERYGWISDYGIPMASTAETVFIDENDKVTIPAKKTEDKDGSTTETPGVVVLGPYYRPESRREITYKKPGTDENGNEFEETITEHEYLLTLDLKDEDNVGPEFKDVVIKELRALFRDTSVYITVTMSSGDVEVYAEISGWNRHEAKGSVNNGDDGKYVDPDKQQ